jgi:hypothetical protein
MTERLFRDYDLREEMETRRREIASEIDGLNTNYILNANIEELCAYFENKYRYDVPVLNTDQITLDQREVDVDVSQDFNRAIFDRSEPFYLKGTAITFLVPFVGHGDLLRCRPSSFTTVRPHGELGQHEVRFEYPSVDHEAERIKSAFDRDLRDVQQYLGFVRENTDQFNGTLARDVMQAIEKRRRKLLNDQGFASSLGFPIRKRDGVAQTYSVPVTRKKLAVRLPSATTQPFKPEPAPETQGYEEILAAVSNMALVLERSPKAFEGMHEEDLRMQFLVPLNAQFEGKASGETFNFEGKTDILIRVEGRNIFIAECKFWTGAEGLKDTIDQLLGYASWRDSKTAILLFNRNKNSSAVLEKIPGTVAAHENFKRQLEYKSDSGFRFVLRQKNDENREITLTVLVFDVPVNSTKERATHGGI